MQTSSLLCSTCKSDLNLSLINQTLYCLCVIYRVCKALGLQLQQANSAMITMRKRFLWAAPVLLMHGPPEGKSSSAALGGSYRALWAARIHAKEATESASTPDPASRGVALVGGGTGFIGKHVVGVLKSKGFDVVVVSRTADASTNQITWSDLATDGLPRNTKAVVNLAGTNVMDFFSRWNDNFKNLVRESRFGTARAMSQAIQRAHDADRPKVFVQITGIGFYPAYDDLKVARSEPNFVPMSEQSEGAPNGDFMADLVRDWEESAIVPTSLGVRNVFIRSGVVLGRTGGMVKNLYASFYLGLGGKFGNGSQPMPWIHVTDLAHLVAHCIDCEELQGPVNGVAPNIIDNTTFVKTFAGELWRWAIFPKSESVLRFILGQTRSEMITKGQIVEPKKALETGFHFRKVKASCY